MAEESQVQEQQAVTNESAGATTPSEPMTLDAARDKIRKGEVKSPEELESLIKQVEGSATTEPSEPAPEPPKEEKAPVPEPQAEEKSEMPKESSPLATVDDFLKALQDQGMTYKDLDNVAQGVIHKEQALNRYKEDVYSLQQKLEEREQATKQLQEEFEKLKKDIDTTPKATSQAPIEPKIELGPMPSPPPYTIDEDEHKRNWDEYQKNLTQYYADLMKQSKGESSKEMAKLKREFADQLKQHGTTVEQLRKEYDTVKQANEVERQKEEQARVREKAFSAAKDFVESNKQYSFSQTIENVSDRYNAINNEILYLCRTDPSLAQIAGKDPIGNIVREYVKGNPYVQNVVGNRAIPISDDIKTYQFLVDLEADAYAHKDFDKHGRPDLEMAYIRQKKIGGVLAQELQDARVEGFQQAEKVRAAVTNGPAQLPADSAPPTEPEVKLTPEQLLEKLKEVNKMQPSQRKAAMEKLTPLLAQANINVT